LSSRDEMPSRSKCDVLIACGQKDHFKWRELLQTLQSINIEDKRNSSFARRPLIAGKPINKIFQGPSLDYNLFIEVFVSLERDEGQLDAITTY